MPAHGYYLAVVSARQTVGIGVLVVIENIEAWAMNSTPRRSVTLKVRDREMSVCQVIGARTRPRPASPKRNRLPLASVGGAVNTAGFTQLFTP